ncbi:MAG TPA: SRPBCC domain-containing protein [Ktedonobacterales bacterium]|nr:SRPBCC domain-containing protein [Ktedonobacterales bacterium]
MRADPQTDEMDKVFGALADRSRRRLLDRLNSRNGQSLRELCVGLDMTRQSVSKHLTVLEEANLVSSVRVGREKLHYLNTIPINDIAERWINEYDQERVRALSDLKRALEGSPVDRPAFVYTIYIKTTPEHLWRALTEPAFTRRWWGMSPMSDWRVGSPMTWEHEGLTVADPAQVVLESEPYRRLAYTWQTMTPELAHHVGVSDEALARMSREPRSRVSFELEPIGQMVKLTVVHEDLEPGGATLEMISGGWPQVLSGLKTLLETGETLQTGS